MDYTPGRGQGGAAAAFPAAQEQRGLRGSMPAAHLNASAAGKEQGRRDRVVLETRGSDTALPSDKEPASSALAGDHAVEK